MFENDEQWYRITWIGCKYCGEAWCRTDVDVALKLPAREECPKCRCKDFEYDEEEEHCPDGMVMVFHERRK